MEIKKEKRIKAKAALLWGLKCHVSPFPYRCGPPTGDIGPLPPALCTQACPLILSLQSYQSFP